MKTFIVQICKNINGYISDAVDLFL